MDGKGNMLEACFKDKEGQTTKVVLGDGAESWTITDDKHAYVELLDVFSQQAKGIGRHILFEWVLHTADRS